MRLVAMALAATLLLAACGGGEIEAMAPPPKVDPALAPKTLPPDLALFENTDDPTVAAFAEAGENALAADGRVWEIRRQDRLIGTLQISTVLPRVDLTDATVRDQLVDEIMPSDAARVRIDDIEVSVSSGSIDRAFFMWFGADVFQVLQLKELGLNFEAVVRSVIQHQQTVPAWRPLLDALDPEDEEDN